MKISIGSDHRGFELKEKIIKAFENINWVDVGVNNSQSTDYPIYAKKVANLIKEKQVDLGILICGSGVGMSIAANRFHGIYAALCWNEVVAKASKMDDNANVLVLPADYIDDELAIKIVKSWIEAKFKGEKYQKRLDMIDGEK
ncbi:MAG: Ribose 5-phosphate isomerase B [candidate division TM6 bacterium GW2011_GWF2_28_16]|nr:MAG: Ribose 5-phosphate isomerase B [candidate division TM6 bacterium GW2011_GWF2_28_16]